MNKQTRRYQLRFNNGYWKVFDTEDYNDVELHVLKKEALQHLKKLNVE